MIQTPCSSRSTHRHGGIRSSLASATGPGPVWPTGIAFGFGLRTRNKGGEVTVEVTQRYAAAQQEGELHRPAVGWQRLYPTFPHIPFVLGFPYQMYETQQFRESCSLR